MAKVITLTGANSFGLQRELEQYVQNFLAAHDAMGLERLDGEETDFQRLAEALTALPFLADERLVVVRNGAANKQFAEALKDLLARMPETTTLVMVEAKLDKRSAYYKLLKKDSDYQEFNELDAGGLVRWLVQQAQTQKAALSNSDAQFLVNRVGPSQQLLAHELDKLILYSPKISRTTIEMLTEPAPQSTVFELLEAAFNGNAKRTLALYQEQRLLKVEPQQIIAMLAWQLHVVALLKTAGGRNPDLVAKESKTNPFVLRKTSTIARKLSLTELRVLLRDLLAIDSRLKRESLDADEAVQNYLVRIATG